MRNSNKVAEGGAISPHHREFSTKMGVSGSNYDVIKVSDFFWKTPKELVTWKMIWALKMAEKMIFFYLFIVRRKVYRNKKIRPILGKIGSFRGHDCFPPEETFDKFWSLKYHVVSIWSAKYIYKVSQEIVYFMAKSILTFEYRKKYKYSRKNLKKRKKKPKMKKVKKKGKYPSNTLKRPNWMFDGGGEQVV